MVLPALEYRIHPIAMFTRAFAALVVTCALLAAMLVAVPSLAHAGVYNPIPADQFGDPTDTFSADDALFFYATSDIKGGRVCVVSATGDLNSLSCGGGWDEGNVVAGVGTVFFLLHRPYLRVGTWRLLSETLPTDGADPEPLAVSAPFSVSPCGNSCDTSLALDMVRDFKETTLASYEIYFQACMLYALRDATAATRSMAADVNSEFTAGLTGKVIQRALVDRLKIDKQFTWNLAKGQVALSLGAGASLIFVPLDVQASAFETKAKEVLHSLVCVLASAYQDLANDPPDPNYGTVEAPTVRPVVPLGDAVSDALATELDRHLGMGYAELTALERYQAAATAGDETAVHRHAAALGRYSFDLADLTESTARALRGYADLLDRSGDFADPVFPDGQARADLQAVFDRVVADGFTDAETANLTSLGSDAAGIENLRAQLELDLSVVPVGTTFSDQLRSLANGLPGQRSGLAAFGRAAESVASATDAPPLSSFDTAVNDLAVDVSSTATSPDGDEPIEWTWDFGDGETATGSSASHAYAGPGTYHVTHRVCDLYDCDTLGKNVRVGVIGEAPTAIFDADRPREEGRLLTIDGSASSDPDDRIIRYDWDFGDGTTFPGGGSTVGHTYEDEGTYPVTLTVTDGDGNTDTARLDLVVDNVAPTISPQVPARVPSGPTRSYDAVVTDPGVTDTRTVTWDFGDGTAPVIDVPASGEVSRAEHAYATTGSYTITVTADDGDGGTTTERVPIEVSPPAADAGPDQSVDEGTPVSLGGPGSSSEDGGRAWFSWDFGDGSQGFSRRPNHVYRDEGTYTARLTVRDVDVPDVEAADSAVVTVRNVAPTVSVLAASAARPGETVSLRAFASDAGADDVLTLTWDFGDGTTAQGAKVTHAFPAGTHTVTLTVTDGDGGTTTVERRVVVSADPPGDGRRDSRGTDFWLAFMPGLDNDDPQVFISAASGTQGVVEVPGIGFRHEFTVGSGAVTKVHLPARVVTTVFDDPLPFGVHVSADSPVSVYGLNHGETVTDGFLGLPREVLGRDYYAVGYDGFSGGQMGVLATQHDTTVHIVSRNGQQVTKTLDAGDVYPLYNGHDDQIGRTAVGIDFTGAHLTADKPVAAYSGATCGNVPTNLGACNHLVEQLTPTSQWGRTFLIAPFATRKDGDRIRVVAAQADTEVRVDDVLVATLGAGDFHEQVVEGGAQVKANKPVQVAQFAHSFGWDLVEADPTMALVVPFEQYLASYVVATADDPFTSHYLNIVTPTGQIGDLELDGGPVASDAFQLIGTSGYAYAQLRVDVGTHRLNGPQPFGLMQYGWGFFDAYGWSGGSQLAEVATIAGLSLSPAAVDAAVGEKSCLDATVVDADDVPVTDARVDWTSIGANPDSGFSLTGIDGIASICLTGAAPGEDRVTAQAAGLSDSSTITWTSPNGAPSATAASVATLAGVPVSVTLAGTDPDDDPLTFAVTDQPGHGSLSGTAPNLTYTPDAGFSGADSFGFTVNDGKATSPPATVAISVVPVNKAPAAQPLSVSTPEDTPLEIALSATDPEGDDLAFAMVDQPTHGTLTGTAPTLSYRPNPDYTGPDSLTFRVCDDGTTDGAPDSKCDTATVSITVTPVDDAPSVSGAPATQQVQYSDAVEAVVVSAIDTDTAPGQLSAAASWKKVGDTAYTTTAPLGGLTLTPLSATDVSPRTWRLGGHALVGAGTYTVRIAVSDDSTAVPTDVTVNVTEEDAALGYTGDVLVTTGSSGAADLRVSANVTEVADGALGETLGTTAVRFEAYRSSDAAMTSAAGSCTASVALTGIGMGTAACTVTGLAADTYTVLLRLLPSGFYIAPREDVVVLVVIPGVGKANGGGWLTEPSLGTRSNFGFTAKALKNGRPQGSSVYIYRREVRAGSVANPSGGLLPAGDYNWIVKSNAFSGIASSCSTTAPTCAATFTGKANVTAVHRASGAVYGLGGNYAFQVDVTDGGEPATTGAAPDTYAIKVTRSGSTYYQLGTPSRQIPISGGNIQVKR